MVPLNHQGGTVAPPMAEAKAPQGRPNLVVILIDDLGARDLGCCGSTFYDTPHIDRLAREGVQLAQAYAASSLCSPARAALLTGRHPVRLGITNFIPGRGMGRLIGPPYRHGLDREERTLATALGEAGYQTWHVGKWHLGGEGSLPTDHGFAVNIGGHRTGGLGHCGYGAPWTIAREDPAPLPGLENAPVGQSITERLTDEAIALVRGRGRESPFFLHLSHYTVHTPLQAPPERVAHYQAKAACLGLDRVPAVLPGEVHPALHYPGKHLDRRVLQSHPVYAAMVEQLDGCVGRLLQALEDEGVAENTLVVFLSDNGGLSTSDVAAPTSNRPFAEGKGWSEEGGLRIPWLMRWPGRLAPALRHEPVWQCDLYPTLLAAAGLPAEARGPLDGINLMPWLLGGQPPADRDFHWHYPYYSNQGGAPSGAIRSGPWKLIEAYESGATALYNLEQDISETVDLSAAEPQRTASLLAALKSWRGALGAVMPRPNPWYDAIVAGALPRPNGRGEFPAGTVLPAELGEA
jgi:arylsulfatase A-like enzyme